MNIVNPSFINLETILIKLNEDIEELNEDSERGSSVNIDETSMNASGTVRKSTLESLSLLFSKSSEELIGDLILHPEHKKTYRQLGKRLRNLDEDLFKQFQSSLGSIQRIAELIRQGKAEELDSFTEHTAKLPFLKTIVSTFFDLHLPADIDKVLAITNPDVCFRVMAQLVNRDKIPLSALNFEKEGLMLLAPHLTFVDCQGAFNDWNKKEIQTFLNACKKINSEMRIHALAQLINQEKIYISTFPFSKQELMHLAPHIKILNCQDALKHWPIEEIETFLNACPRIEELILNDKRITHLPPLPYCKFLHCDGCSCLESLPELPECQKLYCSDCDGLKSLPELPQCTFIDCTHSYNLDLNTFPPALIEKSHLSLNVKNVLAVRDPNVRLRFITKCINDSYHSDSYKDPVPLADFNLTRQELMLLAPHLKNLNCKGLFKGWSIEAIENFLNACPDIVLLWIDSPEIRHLPQRNYENLNCSNCYALESLPKLSNCHNLNCSSCYALENLPELPHCRELNCSNCYALRQLPLLPVCKQVDVVNCYNLEKVDELYQRSKVTYQLDVDQIPDQFLEAALAAVKGGRLRGISQISTFNLLNSKRLPDKFLQAAFAEEGRLGVFERPVPIVGGTELSYLMYAMGICGKNSRQVKLLKEAGADYLFAEKGMDIKFLGLAWGLNGKFSLTDEERRNTLSIDLEGCWQAYTGEKLHFYVTEFFKSKEFNSADPLISKEIQGVIQESIANCYPLTLDSSAEIVKKIKSGKPFVFFTGWDSELGDRSRAHAVSVVIVQDRLIVFNRGSQRDPSAATVYLLPKEDVAEDMISALGKCFKTAGDFFSTIRNLNLQHMENEDFNHKDQEVGNCSWASIKGVFAVLGRLLTDPVLGNKVYKLLSHFIRKRTLQDYIEKSENTDPGIIDKIKKKCVEKTKTSKSFSKDFIELKSQLDQLSTELK